MNPVILLFAAASVAAAHLTAAPTPTIESLKPTAAERDARLGWWREARFGMFVHWGPSSQLGNIWNGKKFGGYSEHIQRQAKIPMTVYRQEVVATFNPVKFDADEWVSLAKAAGMGYLVITAKHHDGFAMFPSAASDYNIAKATPFGRDPMLELRDACRRHDIRFGFYYSHAFDWGEPDAPGNDWDYQNPGGDRHLAGGREWWLSAAGKAFLPKARSYVDRKAIPQLRELISTYQPDILWFDTPHKLPPQENLRVLAAVREAGPRVIVNGRLVHSPQLGDYESTWDRPEDFPTFDPDYAGDWEGVPTTNGSYGYSATDRSHKSVSHFCRLLAKSVARGGNQLLNIGPKGDGTIDAPDAAILRGLADWWRVNGESIRGAGRSPLAVQAWGESTLGRNNRLYLHVFDWPEDGRLVIGNIRAQVTSATLLSNPGVQLPVSPEGDSDLVIKVPETCPDPRNTVIALDCAAPPEGNRDERLLATNIAENKLRTLDARLTGKATYGAGRTEDNYVCKITGSGDTVRWSVRLSRRATFDASISYDAPGSAEAATLEGDAGKETTGPTRGAGGQYKLTVGDQTLTGKVRNGLMITEKAGRITLEPGRHELVLAPVRTTGSELFRPRHITLAPIRMP